METYDGPAWRLMATPLSAPFQGFARQTGIQVFRLYSRPSPVTEDRNGEAGFGWGGGHRENVSAA
jgi:hypothetical protein